jgi:CheY-like chemotaxis protein
MNECLAKKRILVVEDDEDIRLSLQELLEDEGYQVSLASNGAQALDFLSTQKKSLPNLILLDLMMPVKDGVQFRKEQMSDPCFKKIPVIVMSADCNKKGLLESTGCSVYLTKPIDIDDIIRAVSQHAKFYVGACG